MAHSAERTLGAFVTEDLSGPHNSRRPPTALIGRIPQCESRGPQGAAPQRTAAALATEGTNSPHYHGPFRVETLLQPSPQKGLQPHTYRGSRRPECPSCVHDAEAEADSWPLCRHPRRRPGSHCGVTSYSDPKAPVTPKAPTRQTPVLPPLPGQLGARHRVERDPLSHNSPHRGTNRCPHRLL